MRIHAKPSTRNTLAALLLLTTPAFVQQPIAPDAPQSFRWMKSIHLPASTSAAFACTVLDQEIFAHAAPALRDLRLFQTSPQVQALVPYAIEESYDEASLNSGITASTDRSLYETSATVPLTREGASLTAHLTLPPHVPVERILFSTTHRTAPEHQPHANPVQAHAVTVQAQPQGSAAVETIPLTLAPQQFVLPITIGANLQQPAQVTITIAPSANGQLPAFTTAQLQMRRRTLCFPSHIDGALALYFGNEEEIPAPSYRIALPSVSSDRDNNVSLGPLAGNPLYQPPLPQEPLVKLNTPSRRRTYFAILASLLLLLLTRILWRFRKT